MTNLTPSTNLTDSMLREQKARERQILWFILGLTVAAILLAAICLAPKLTIAVSIIAVAVTMAIWLIATTVVVSIINRNNQRML